MESPRKTTDVAVGVLQRSDGAVLLADRPLGKPYPGYWEFPGGKIETGESVDSALSRELNEELGIEIERPTPWVTFEFTYPHAHVRLHLRRVAHWRGVPQGQEGQRVGFFRLNEPPQPLLPAAAPALRWLALPTHLVLVSARPSGLGERIEKLEEQLRCNAGLIVVDDLPTVGGERGIVPRRISRRAFELGVPIVLAGLTRRGRYGRLVEGDDLASLSQHTLTHWLGLRVGANENVAATLQTAARLRCDFAVVEAKVADSGSTIALALEPDAWSRIAPLPVYLAESSGTLNLSAALAAGAHGIAVRVENTC